ncbi:DNA polymerase/3'-5' exonuclease PolX [Bacillaceae bacterium S4-13-58]
MQVNKKDVIRLLEKIAIFLELKGENTFKVSAYRKAAQALERDERSLYEIEDVTQMKGIGKGTAAVIKEYMETGKSETLQQLEKEVPEGLLPLLQLPGMGGKKVAKLYHELGVIDMASLKKVCESGKVASLAGFGEKTVGKILKSIEEAGKRPERFPIVFMLPIADHIQQVLSSITAIQRYSLAGSLRRGQETVKDLDFIISSENSDAVRTELLDKLAVKEIVANGDTKVSVIINDSYDVSIDFRLVSDDQFATTLHHFTGSKDHNVQMRKLAKEKGEKISEYGVENLESGEVITFSSEEDFFHHFGLDFIPPEIREGTDEVETYKNPEGNLISLEDIVSDLHMHTTFSDGAHSLEEMIQNAQSLGYYHLAITDHSKFLKVANGLDENRIRQQQKKIKEWNQEHSDFKVLSGTEMDILPDGSLDFDDDFLSSVDFVIGSIHSAFSQPKEQIMKRLRNAMENPHVDMIAHPTGRVLGRRTGYEIDVETLLKWATETKTIIELNANPNRLDLSWRYLRKAQEMGALIAINTDAHNIDMLKDMKLGVKMARKGWVRKETVVNTWSTEKLEEFLRTDKALR